MSPTVWYLAVLTGCSGVDPSIHTPSAVVEPGTPLYGGAGAADSVAVLIGAGDIANCDSPGDERTAHLLDSLLEDTSAPTWIFTAGDNAYGRGTRDDFANCYAPSWGRFRNMTRPVPGNHEYKNGFLYFLGIFKTHADPYFAYFNAFPGQVGKADEGWYHYRHGTWDVYALNSGKKQYIDVESDQLKWLDGKLAHGPAECSVAYIHHPRFSAGKHGDQKRMRATWDLLAESGVDILVAGHDHDYQRFAPQNNEGRHTATGIREFVVGTGGTTLRSDSIATAGRLQRLNVVDHGVLKLTLRPGTYEWEFVTVDGTVWDSGSSSCQNTSRIANGVQQP